MTGLPILLADIPTRFHGNDPLFNFRLLWLGVRGPVEDSFDDKRPNDENCRPNLLLSLWLERSVQTTLFDDILTTGATCSEAAAVLKGAGAAAVTAVVIARTPSSR